MIASNSDLKTAGAGDAGGDGDNERNELVESLLSHVSYWNGFPVVLRKFQVFSGPCVGGCIVLGCHLRAVVVDGITSAFCAAHHAGTRAGC